MTRRRIPYASNITNVNGTIYFTADDGVHGRELWKMDPAGGALLVHDVLPGAFSSSPRDLVNANGMLYFRAMDQTTSRFEAFKTDGTAAGTVRVSDLSLGLAASKISSGHGRLVNVGATVYFVGQQESNGYELWKTDGTPAGTMIVKDIHSGAGSSSPLGLTNANGTLFFQASDIEGAELWKSDGTAAGTVRVKDIRVGGLSSNPANITAVNDGVFFTLDGNTLWTSDGTADGTVQIHSFRASSLTNVDGTLYFTNPSADQLWKSDGSVAGTVMLADFDGWASTTPISLVNVGGRLFFAANDSVHGFELWTSDGTISGTMLVKDIHANNSGFPVKHLVNGDGTLYFVAEDSFGVEQLWSSDGTEAGTQIAWDPAAIPGRVFPENLAVVDGKLFLTATGEFSGRELWVAELPPRGDYDRDGQVDGRDFLAWQRAHGAVVSPSGSGADGDRNGVVDAGDLAVWQANFGTSNSTAAAAAVASEFSIAALNADEERAEFVVDDGEGFGGTGVGSAADAAFAWLAGDRAATDRGGWQRSASGTELLARDWAARSARSAVTAGGELRDDGGISLPARKLRGAEFAFDECTPHGDGHGEESPAAAFDPLAERSAAFLAF